MNTSTYKYLAVKIFKLIFHDLVEWFHEIEEIENYAGTKQGIVSYLGAAWRSDDDFKYVVHLHTKASPTPEKIEAGVYIPLGDLDSDEWQLDTDYTDKATEIFRMFTGGTLQAFSGNQTLLFFRIAGMNEEPDMECHECKVGLIDNDHDKMANKNDVFECPICSTKLRISREIKIVYDVN